MSQDLVTDTKKKLDDLGHRIEAARSAPGATGELSDEAAADWKKMVDMHAEIRRKLDAQTDHPAGVIEGLRFDVDILRTAFEKWVAKVEGGFGK